MRFVPDEPAVRRLALSTLVNTTGRGIYFTLSALYFTRIVGFSVVQVGLALSIAAGVALFAGLPLGHLADRLGPATCRSPDRDHHGAVAALLLVQDWWQFVLLATLLAIVDRGSGGGPPGDDRRAAAPRQPQLHQGLPALDHQRRA